MVKPAGSRAMTNNGVPILRFYGQHGAKPRRELVAKRGGPFLQDYNILQFFFTVAQLQFSKNGCKLRKKCTNLWPCYTSMQRAIQFKQTLGYSPICSLYIEKRCMLIPWTDQEIRCINRAGFNHSLSFDRFRFFGQPCAKSRNLARLAVHAHSNLNHKYCKYPAVSKVHGGDILK